MGQSAASAARAAVAEVKRRTLIDVGIIVGRGVIGTIGHHSGTPRIAVGAGGRRTGVAQERNMIRNARPSNT